MKTFHVITLFPEALGSYIQESIIARAQKNKLITIKFYNPRDFVKPTKLQQKKDKPYKRIDDTPYGGGPGMVMQAMPIIKAIAKALASTKKAKTKIIFFSPEGTQFNNNYAASTVEKYDHIILICGRYEGIDARIKKIWKMEDVTIGPYVLTGGELPALVMIDTIARHIPGVLGNFDSREEARTASHDVYTRPEILSYKGRKYRVPEVLLSGDHKKIEAWRTIHRKGA
jgi:tRNA (guanine37-N1)-methyltransferase